jgi:outer membrane protein TolC
VADLRSRLEQGLIPPNDVLSAEAQEARQRLLAIEAGTTLAVARADLARLLGADDPASMIPVATLEAPVADAVSGPELVDAARRQRPEVRSLADLIEAARARVDAARASALPQVGLAGGYDYARPNPRIFPRAAAWEDSWDVSVNVSWPLWDGGRNRAARAAATAGVAAAEARSRDFDRQLTFEVRQRMLEVDQARAAIAAAEVGLRAAEEAFRVVGERFQAGVATNTDVLDAETAALQAALDRTRALAGARLAAARLERAVGR